MGTPLLPSQQQQGWRYCRAERVLPPSCTSCFRCATPAPAQSSRRSLCKMPSRRSSRCVLGRQVPHSRGRNRQRLHSRALSCCTPRPPQLMDYEPAPLGPKDIEIRVTHNGLCHTDIHLVRRLCCCRRGRQRRAGRRCATAGTATPAGGAVCWAWLQMQRPQPVVLCLETLRVLPHCGPRTHTRRPAPLPPLPPPHWHHLGPWRVRDLSGRVSGEHQGVAHPLGGASLEGARACSRRPHTNLARPRATPPADSARRRAAAFPPLPCRGPRGRRLELHHIPPGAWPRGGRPRRG
jgi:hypothetical protein